MDFAVPIFIRLTATQLSCFNSSCVEGYVNLMTKYVENGKF